MCAMCGSTLHSLWKQQLQSLSSGDRPIEITLERAWRALSLAQRVQLLAALASGLVQPLPKVSVQEVERLKDDDMVNAFFTDVGRNYPQVGHSGTVVIGSCRVCVTR